MPVNRWNIDVRKNAHVSAHHPRGGTINGTVVRIYTMEGYGKQLTLDTGQSCGLDDVFKVNEIPASYVTTYCNQPHRTKDGKPIGHGCYILPPAALRAEITGDTDEAIRLLQAGKPFAEMRRGVKG